MRARLKRNLNLSLFFPVKTLRWSQLRRLVDHLVAKEIYYFFLAGTLLVGAFFSGSVSYARVFDINTENFASYFRGQYGTTNLARLPFEPNSGTGAVYDLSYTTLNEYEFGFIYASRPMSLKFAIGVVKPPNLKEIKATSAAGTDWYTVNSNISVAVPKIGIELNIKQWPTGRLILFGDFGTGSATVENGYTFTAAGSAAFNNIVDYREEVKSNATCAEYGAGLEVFAFDTTTMLIDVGYRNLKFASFTHNVAATTFQGTVAKGDAAKNTDGTSRTLDFSGPFASISFRFWIK